MRKKIPFQFLVLLITSLLVGSLFIEFRSTQAESTSEKTKKDSHLNEIFQHLEMESFQGKKISLKDVPAPIVILNFWASWCTPCLAEFPSLVTLQEKFGEEKVKVIGINCDEIDQEQNIQKIQKKFRLNFDIVADKNGGLHQKFGVEALPVTLIFYKGKVHRLIQGISHFDDAKTLDELSKLLIK